jgi:hypothetical protein
MSTTITKAGEGFAKYVDYVFKAILESLGRSELSDVQVLAIFLQLSAATTKDELESTVKSLTDRYPALKEVAFKEKIDSKEKFDSVVQSILSALIKEGKAKEAEAFASKTNTLNGSLDSLKQEFAEYYELYI